MIGVLIARAARIARDKAHNASNISTNNTISGNAMLVQ